MKSPEALGILAELTSQQWGMVTSAQASAVGVNRLTLARLTESGHLKRLAHGVYLDAGAPETEFDNLRAAWLSTDPKLLAHDRIGVAEGAVVVAGESAARLHRIGDFRVLTNDFVSPARRQSQRAKIRFRQRVLDPHDVTVVEGLPVMTVERTIADLVEDRADLSLVADALRDASEMRILDLERLSQLLAPLAARNGLRKDDGRALLNRFQVDAGIDIESVAKRVAKSPEIGALVAANYLGQLSKMDFEQLAMTPAMQIAISALQDNLAHQLRQAPAPQMEAMDASVASVAGEAVFDATMRRDVEQVVTSTAIRAAADSWAAPASHAVDAAQQADVIRRMADRTAAQISSNRSRFPVASS